MTDTLTSVPRIDTPRLVLRPLGADDIDAIVDGVGNYDVVRWLSQAPYPYGPADARAFIADAGGDLTWAIDHQGRLVGVISLKDDLGYWLARSAWGQGFAFEAAQAALTHWFDDPRRGDMIARHYLDNARSELVLRCLGFRPEGVIQMNALALSQTVDCRELRLTRDDWQARAGFDVSTERLRLRELTRSDAHALVDLTTPAVARMVSSIPESFTVATAKSFINQRRWRGVPGFLVGIEGPDGALVGCIGCGGSPVTAMIFLGEDHWGKGYASEASAAFVAELFDRFPVSAIHAEHFADNPASGNVILKQGFTFVDEHPGTSQARLEPAPVVEYRLTRDAYQAST
ncbi:MAG: GNAT family N-acetyltransferase [Pseudomonadota bacterium]